MKSEVTTIAKNTMNKVALNSKVSIAPAACSELMIFIGQNPNFKTLDVLKFYTKEINRISYETFKNN